MTILDSRTSWLRLWLTLAVAMIGNAGIWTIIVLLPSVQAEFGLDRGDASLTYAATMLGFAAGNMWVGRLIDRHGITAALVLAAIAIGAGHAGVALASNLWLIAGLQFVVGLGTAASFGPLIADVSQWFLRRRGIAVAIAASGNYISGALWPLVLSSLIPELGWRLAYGGMGALTVLVMIPLALMLRARVPAEAQATSSAAAALRARATGLPPNALVWLLALAGVACCVAMSMPQVHIVAYCIDLGYGPAVGAEMLSLMLMGGIVSRLASGWLADRIGGLPTLILGSALQMLALFLYLPSDALVPLYVVSLIFGLSQGGIVPAYAVIVREYLPAQVAGARVGFVIMATILGMALGGWLSGVIYDLTGSYTWAFLNGIAWNALNLGIALFILWRGRRLQSGANPGTSPATA